MNIHNKIGPPVEGDDFFGREKELGKAWKLITSKHSLILSAPRRVGKSSFSKKLLSKAKAEDWKTLYLDLEQVRSEKEFIQLFIEKLQETNWWEKSKAKISGTVTQIMESIKPNVSIGGGSVEISIDWKSQKPEIFTQLEKVLDHHEDTLIVIDELAIFLKHLIESPDGTTEVTFFLNWLRSLRQKPGSQIRWIFCSSIGIDNFTHIHGLSHTLNDVPAFSLGEYTPEEAEQLLILLAQSENISFEEQERKHLLNLLQWHLPYFIQILFSEVILSPISYTDKQISIPLIDAAYQQLTKNKCLNTWDERLKEYAEYESPARQILKRLAQATEGETRKNLFALLYSRINDTDKTEDILSKVLNMLNHDGYTILSKDKHLFRSPLLRDFWYNLYIA